VEVLMNIVKWVGYLFAIIGFSATVWKSIQAWLSLKSFSWNEFDKHSKQLIKKISSQGYYPDLIVTIGRGGAILGSIISGNLLSQNANIEKRRRNIPILGCDRMYEWENGQRIEVPNRMIDLKPLKGNKVLLVAGDILTGSTIKFFLKQVEEVDPESVKTACLVKGITATFSPDFFGKEIPGDFRMPWMYKGYGYVRDSRRPT